MKKNWCNVDLSKKNKEKYPFTLILFGGTGDLARKKLLPSLYSLFKAGELSGNFKVIAYARSNHTHEDYRKEIVKKAIEAHALGEDESLVDSFSQKFYYVAGDIGGSHNYKEVVELCREIKSPVEQLIFYLAVMPELVEELVDDLKETALFTYGKKCKIVVEKPFGRNAESAKALNKKLLSVFKEEEIYRIDHYLGKETVQNIFFFRFGNSIFEPLWNRNFIDHIQITAAEDIGIEGRGRFYEGAGVVRDMVQNHMLQLLAFTAMEVPASFSPDRIRDEKLKVYQSVRGMDDRYISRNMAIGQYGPGKVKGENVPGYREEKDVANDSRTPTYIAAKIYIDNWRWADVPFYLRAGKRMAKKVTEIYIQFKQPPLKLFGNRCREIVPNWILLSIQPEEKITLRLNMKYPGHENLPHPVETEFDYKDLGNVLRHDAYERLILDCIKGDLTLFASQDGIEAMWEIVDPINIYFEAESEEELPNYFSGTWGPEKAKNLLEKEGRKWHND